jgi:Pyruvate/2-oxoacid:ferredoxin oxidoreductase delta subunit
MNVRKIVKINEKKCIGCGVCIPNCPEGAIPIIDGKARLISDIFCDGLGACIGECPERAIETIEREAAPYDEKKTMRENIIKAGKNTIIAHLNHLNEHGEKKYLAEALEVLKVEGIEIDLDELKENKDDKLPWGYPGSSVKYFTDEKIENKEIGSRISQLRQWPVQLHLIPSNTSYFKGKDVILVADCVGYTIGDFHKDYLKGRSLAIACPKLDNRIERYVEKLTSMLNNSKIKSLTVMTMEVLCCSGLLSIAKKASENASRKIQIKSIVVGIKGDILKEEWI